MMRHAENCEAKKARVADRDRRLRDYLQDYAAQIPESTGAFKRIQQGGLPSLGKKK
jgi:hypothetical protein